ncbi:MAG: hypothetical protein LBV72_03950 [Tannerella sp.]|jgi:hypothetical protein|nr:hypothetical protein [Tannerella sp.]
MRKAVIIFGVFAFMMSGCGGKETKQQAETAEEYDIMVEDGWQPAEDQAETELPHIDREFISFFFDMVFGEYVEGGKRIPKEMANRYLPDFLTPWESVKDYITDEDEEYEWMYAVGKITGYNGLDLFLCTYESENVYGSDNHTGFLRYLLPFKNGIPITNDEVPKQRLVLVTDFHYLGEGGETVFKSYFDTDTTVVSHLCASESESATGYGTPLITTEGYRWKIDKNGGKEIIDITKKEYSSPFYDRNFLKEQNWTGIGEDERKPYPNQDNRWSLSVNSLHYNEFALVDPIQVRFYIKEFDGELFPVFEIYDVGEKLLDSYTVGQAHENNRIEKNYASRSIMLKCPIIIKTSDGDLELLPNGKFLLKATGSDI